MPYSILRSHVKKLIETHIYCKHSRIDKIHLIGKDISKAETLHIPYAMTDIIPSPNKESKARPFSDVIAPDCFT